MNPQILSSKYHVRRLEERDIPDIYALCIKNPLYYEYCPPVVTPEGIKSDMEELPPNTAPSQKYYLGFYEQQKLIAVLDLIDGYPTKENAFIGFFMIDTSIQKQGIGSQMIEEVCDVLTKEGFGSIRLAWVKGNPQAEHFWKKNGFQVLKETSSNAADSVMLAERKLK